MKDNYTHISLVVDRSGSMVNIAADTAGGINTFVEGQQKEPGEATFYLIEFDDQHNEVFGPDDIKKAVRYNLVPRGSTALYDAIGRAINKTGEYLADKPEDERPAKVVFVIATDGMNNASREFSLPQIRDMVNKQRDSYKWEFVFLGANIDAFAVGDTIGTRGTQYYATSGSTQSVYRNLGQTVSQYRGAAGGQSMAPVASVDADGNTIEDDKVLAKQP